MQLSLPLIINIYFTAHHKASFAEVHVMVNGTGMSEKIKNNLFNKKHTSKKGTEEEIGTDLGLLLVRDFVAQHGGAIHVESEEGKGTTVIFTIPLGKEDY
jgi:two-component system, sensor histidine kinase and response regulator